MNGTQREKANFKIAFDIWYLNFQKCLKNSFSFNLVAINKSWSRKCSDCPRSCFMVPFTFKFPCQNNSRPIYLSTFFIRRAFKHSIYWFSVFQPFFSRGTSGTLIIIWKTLKIKMAPFEAFSVIPVKNWKNLWVTRNLGWKTPSLLVDVFLPWFLKWGHSFEKELSSSSRRKGVILGFTVVVVVLVVVAHVVLAVVDVTTWSTLVSLKVRLHPIQNIR